MLKIVEAIKAAGGYCLIVGGAVRDKIMGIEGKDVDVEVYQLEADALKQLLGTFGNVIEAGKSFGVLKLRYEGVDYDFSLPRRENKVGRGHKGFQVEMDSTMTPTEAAARRDFSMNSVFMDPLTEMIFDPYSGIADIESLTLRHTSDAFSEDPLRVLRGMQFAGRFNMTVNYVTAEICQAMRREVSDLPKERIWEEWRKWAAKSVVPSTGIKFLVDTHWIYHYPEIWEMSGCKQEAEWHPEGDAFVHTLLCVDAAADIAIRDNLSEDDRCVLLLATLCHDMGKTTTTEFVDGRIRSRGHEQAGEIPTLSFLDKIGCPQKIKDQVVALVVNHLAHLNCQTEKAVRRLAMKMAPSNIDMLLRLIEADHNGRPPLPKGLPDSAIAMREIADVVGVKMAMPKRIVQGRDLMTLGVTPGPAMGLVLSKLFDAQLDGAFTDLEDGLIFYKNNFTGE